MVLNVCNHWLHCKWAESARNFILSPPFQAAVQFSVGTFVAGLFVFIRPISFPLSCLAALLLVVVVAVLSPDNHIGTRLLGSATLLGAMAWGLVLGGAALSLVHVAVRSYCRTPVGCSAHTALLCCLAVVVLGVLCVNRAALGPPFPPHVWVAGMVSTLSFGLVLIAGQFVTNLITLWTDVVGGLLLSCLVASGFSALVSLLVLPSLATDEMRADTAAAIRGIGHAASRFASRGLRQEERFEAPCQSQHPHPLLHLHPNQHPLWRPPPYRDRSAAAVPLAATKGPNVGRAPTRGSVEQPEVTTGAAAAVSSGRGSAASQPPPRQQQQQTTGGGPTSSAADAEEGSFPAGNSPPSNSYSRCGSSGHPPVSSPLTHLTVMVSSPGASGTRQRPSSRDLWYRENLPPSPRGEPATASARSEAAAPTCPVAAVCLPPESPASPQPGRSREGAILDRWDSAASSTAAAATATGHGGEFGGSGNAGGRVAVDFSGGGGGGEGGRGGSISLPSSAPTSDDERPPWPLHPMSRPRGGGGGSSSMYGISGDGGDFEHVMEDEDAFLRLLQEATAPQAPYSSTAGGDAGAGGRGGRRRGGASAAATAAAASRRAPPPVVAPPGGILPSPSTRDLMGLGGAASVSIVMAAKPPLSGVSEPGAAKAAADGMTAARTGGQGEGEAAGLPGGGGATAYGGGGLGGSPVAWAPVSALRPLIARARTCLGAAAVEPPWMLRGPADLAAWSRVLAACEALLNRVAALECLLEDHRPGQNGHVLGDVSLAAVLGVDIVAPYRSVYGEVAASCAAMSVAVAASIEGPHSCSSRSRSTGSPSHAEAFAAVGGWQSSKERLRSLVRMALSTYWSRVRAATSNRLYHHNPHHFHHHHHQHLKTSLQLRNHEGGGGIAGVPTGSAHSREGIEAAGSALGEWAGAAGELPERRSDGGAQDNHQLGHHQSLPVPVHLHHHIRLKPAAHHAQPHQQLQQPQQQQQDHHHYHHHDPYSRQQPEHHLGGRHRVAKIRTVTLHQARALTFLWTVTEGVITAMDELEAAVQSALLPPPSTQKAAAASGTQVKAEPEPPSTPLPPSPQAPVSPFAGRPSLSSNRTVAGTRSKNSGDSTGGGGGGGDNADYSNATKQSSGGGVSFPVVSPGDGAPGPQGDCGTAAAAGGIATAGALPLLVPGVPEGGQQAAADLDVPQPDQSHTAGPQRQHHHQPHLRGPGQGLWGWFHSVGAALANTACELGRWGWAWPLVEITLGLPMLRYCAVLLASHCRTLLLHGSAARRALLRQRLFQYGVKYWVVSAGVLCLILGLAALPELEFMRRYPMLYAYIATAVSMTDRVESTLSRSALRAGGTLAGGVLGLWVMLLHEWAHSPAGLLAIVTLVAFLTGCLATHRLLYGMYLTVGTLLSIVFCQYGTTPYCCTTPGGTLEMFAARVVSVLLGCTLPVLFSQAVLPWYTSDWALEIMAGAFLGSAKIVRGLYDTFFEEHLRAHVASCGAGPTADLLRQYGMDEQAETLLRQAEAEPTADEKECPQVVVAMAVEEGAEQHQRTSSGTDAAEAARASAGAEGLRGSAVATKPRPKLQLDREGEASSDSAACGTAAAGGDSSSSSSNGGSGGGGAAKGPQEAVPVAPSAERFEALANRADAAAVAAATAAALRTEVSGPLVAVQTSLMKDTVVWSRGIYAVPQIVPAVLRCGLLLADRLAALQLVVADTPPPVNGRLSGWAFEKMVLPLHRDTLGVLAALDRVAVATAALLDPTAASARMTEAANGGASSGDGGDGSHAAGEAPLNAAGSARHDGDDDAQRRAQLQKQKPSHQLHQKKERCSQRKDGAQLAEEGGVESPDSPAAAADELRATVQELHLSRLQIRQHVHDMRRAFHADVRSLDEQHLSYATHPDDTVHVNSMLYALVKTLDKATALARTALELRSAPESHSGGAVRRWLAGCWRRSH